jgi:hypothetical protein
MLRKPRAVSAKRHQGVGAQWCDLDEDDNRVEACTEFANRPRNVSWMNAHISVTNIERMEVWTTMSRHSCLRWPAKKVSKIVVVRRAVRRENDGVSCCCRSRWSRVEVEHLWRLVLLDEDEYMAELVTKVATWIAYKELEQLNEDHGGEGAVTSATMEKSRLEDTSCPWWPRAAVLLPDEGTTTTIQSLMVWYMTLTSSHTWPVDETGDACGKHDNFTQIGVIKPLQMRQCHERDCGVEDVLNGGGNESNSKTCSWDKVQAGVVDANVREEVHDVYERWATQPWSVIE